MDTVVTGQVLTGGPADADDVTLDLLGVAYRLRAGHRLALDVMSSDFPDHLPEVPAGQDPWTALPGEPGVRGVTVGGARPSCLRIG